MNSSYALSVTGSIGCGKSYVCARLRRLAAGQGLAINLIEVDRLRATLLESRTKEQAKQVQSVLIECFGSEICLANGTLNRRRLADIIYSDLDALEVHDRVLDPVIFSQIADQISSLSGITLVEWALVAEKNAMSLTQGNVLFVECSRETQLLRLSCGDLPSTQIEKRIALQLTNQQKRAKIEMYQSKHGGNLYCFNNEGRVSVSNLQELLDRITAALVAERTVHG